MEANNKTNPHLFTALKGSQNNLAIITRLDIVAFEQPLLRGGTAFYDAATVPKQIEAFVQFVDDIEKDPYGSLIFNWVYIPASKQIQIENLYEYTRPLLIMQPNIHPRLASLRLPHPLEPHLQTLFGLQTCPLSPES